MCTPPLPLPLPSPQTVGYDPLVPAEEASQFGVEFMELDQIWPIADFVTLHVPLIPPTKGEPACVCVCVVCVCARAHLCACACVWECILQHPGQMWYSTEE